MSLKVEYKRSTDQFVTIMGTRVFLGTGEEIQGITSIGLPVKGVDGLLEVTITAVCSDVKVVD